MLYSASQRRPAGPRSDNNPSPRLLHGPAQRPMQLFDPDQGWDSRADCHGIMPTALAAAGVLAGHGLHGVALLDRLLTFDGQAPGGAVSEMLVRQALDGYRRLTGVRRADLPEAQALRDALVAANRNGVLPLAGSAALAARAAEALWPGFGAAGGGLWCVKEGHTASVWRAAPPSGSAALALCLLVPRDADADAEQRVSFDQLGRIGTGAPVPVVVEHARLRLDAAGRAMTVLATEWIESARELHLLDTPEGPRLMAVEGFANGYRPVGALLDLAETARAAAAMRALVRHGMATDTRRFAMTGFEINDGDFVIDRAGAVSAVAASANPPPRSLAEMIARYADFGGRCARTGRRLTMDAPELLAGELAMMRDIDWRGACDAILAERTAPRRWRNVAQALRRSA